MNMVKKIGMVIVGATLVVAHCLIGGMAFAQSPQTECPPECVIDTLEIETYYPSPYGYYEELRGDKIIVGDTDNSHIDETHLPPSGTITFEPKSYAQITTEGTLYEGTVYYDSFDHEFKYYDEASTWQPLGGGGGDYWKPSTATGGSNDIYSANTGNVGIGVGESDAIGAKLQVVAVDQTKKSLIIKAGSSSSMSGFSSNTPGTYTYVIPSGVSQVQIVAAGGKGGDGLDVSSFGYPSTRGYGGNGGKVEARASVTSGTTLSIVVGAIGASASGTAYRDGGQGGGYSRVLSGATVIAVGAGGGGAGGEWLYTENSFKKVFPGGNGGSGGPSGGGGTNGTGGYGGGNGGAGGTTSAGGVGGAEKTCSGSCIQSPGFCYTYSPGGTGSSFQGGNGGAGGIIASGGAGGSGYFGGGGGTAGTYANEGGCGNNNNYGSSAGGGGGGASYIISSATVVTNSAGVNPGAGYVTITPIIGGTSNTLTEWQDNSGVVLSAIDINGNLALGSSSANGYKLYVNGSAYVTSGAWTASDLRFKENILPLNNSLDKILNIQPVSFDWNKSGYPDMNFDPSRQIGLVAQEVEKQIPELVHTDINGYKAVAYDKLTAVLVEAVKEQQAQMRNQQKKIEILELKLKELDEKK